MSGVYHVYKVVRGADPDELESRVNFLLNSGWVLTGGVVVANGVYMQAMAFTSEEKPT